MQVKPSPKQPSEPHHIVSSTSTAQIKIDDVIRLILQFLQENKLNQTFQTLQKESRICLNITDRTRISQLINESKWDVILKELNYLSLPEDTLFELFELMTDDLIDRDAFQAAYFILKNCIQINEKMTSEHKQKILRLEFICEQPSQKAMHHKPPTHYRRQSLINKIIRQTYQQIQKSRLLSLISSALKYEASKGVIVPNLSYSLLSGKHQNIQNQSEQMITRIDKKLKYSEQTRITAVSISNKGEYIALGGIDGLIQIYDPIDYKLDTISLKFQAEDVMLYHEDSIDHMVFSETDEMLASVDSKGLIKIWSMESGKLLRKIQYGKPVACCCWGVEQSQFLIGYQNAQLYGIRSCNILKEYLCGTESNNQQYLLDLAIGHSNLQGTRVYTFGQTGTIRVFNFKTQEQVYSVNINRNVNSEILKVVPFKNKDDENLFYICAPHVVLTFNGRLEQVGKYQVTGSGDNIELVNAAFSQNYVYECIKKQDQKHVIQVRDLKTGRIVHSVLADAPSSKMVLHKLRNLLVSYSKDETLSFWRP